jgi:hypothetical protein
VVRPTPMIPVASQPSASSSAMPVMPRRRTRAPIVVAAALVTLVGGVVAWRIGARPRQARAAEPAVVAARAAPPAPPTVMVAEVPPSPAAPSVAAIEPTIPEPTIPEPAAAEPDAVEPTAEPASDPVAAGDPAAKLGRSVTAAKRPIVRVKLATRREPPRPIKRVAAISAPAPAAAAAAAEPIAVAPAAPAAPPPAPVMEASPPPPVVAAAEAPRPSAPATEMPMTMPMAPPAQLPLGLARPAPAGSFDATPSIASLDVKGSLSPSVVRRSIERTLGAMRSCYRTAAKAGGTTPEVELKVSFEIDENSLATQVATGGASFGSLAGCAAGITGKIRTPEAPDVGTAQVTVVIRFRPS